MLLNDFHEVMSAFAGIHILVKKNGNRGWCSLLRHTVVEDESTA